MEQYIKINSLYKKFDNGFELNASNINLTNQLYYLQGPNGSGKSVFLRIIGKIDNKYEGEIINPKDKILFLTNNDVNFEFLTLKENIELFYNIYHLRPNFDNINLIYSNNQLNDLAKISSLGTKLKTGISLIFQSNYWDLIILDETLSAIDQNSIKIINRELNSRINEGTTVIITSHTEKMNLTDCKNLKIEKGEIYEEKD